MAKHAINLDRDSELIVAKERKEGESFSGTIQRLIKAASDFEVIVEVRKKVVK